MKKAIAKMEKMKLNATKLLDDDEEGMV